MNWVLAASVLLSLAAIPVLGAVLYLVVLTLGSRRSVPPAPRPPQTRFQVVIPAHDEEGGISATVRDLLAADYPGDLFRLLVVADNCSDGTAAAARTAGADVLVRTDAEKRGKGFALELAYAQMLEQGWAGAVVVVDADTVASANLLRAFDARLQLGAEALQAHYGVRNPGAGWRTRLMVIALSLFHGVRSLGRERLGVSCGLRGNGMCFTTGLLRRVPHDAFSLVEDLEYGIKLGEAGVAVRYVAEAEVLGEMVTSASASVSQRRRWEEGRQALRRRTWSLLIRALQGRSGLLADLALDLLVPPLVRVAAAVLLGLAASTALAVLAGPTLPLGLFSACAAGLLLYVARGWVVSGTGLRGLVGLAWAPIYMLWKLTTLRKQERDPEWVRTRREGGSQ